MNKTRFRLLVFFMSLSLIGIILVQLYWVNSSLKSSNDQFQYKIQIILNKISDKLKKQEEDRFLKFFDQYTESTGHEPSRKDLYPLYQNGGIKQLDENAKSKKLEGSDYSSSDDATKDIKAGNVKSGTNVVEAHTGKRAEGKDYQKRPQLNNIDLYLMDFREFNPIESWLTKDKVRNLIASELEHNKVNIEFEYAIYNNQLPTKIKSDNFRFIENNLEDYQIFDGENSSRLLILSFPMKEEFLFSSILSITLLSIIFTLIIIIAYVSAINQLVKQKQISEIKTDFINNMTHEFKTPIATINLALDAIKNPKIFIDPEKVQRYLQMIRDENKRMHAQVENVLQISRLDKKELDITKDQADIHDVLEEAIEHVHLIIEARHGILTRHYDAQRTTALLNDVHFTNILVNILDNAIKYSPDEPVIDIYTENVKDFILIKIKDSGLGMSKVTQKRIFEKFFREHTGDIHNVKGHGLGLAYVKRIIDDHNCHIYVESEKGKGSTFIIKMPLIN